MGKERLNIKKGSKKLTVMLTVECVLFALLVLAFILYKTGIIRFGSKDAEQNTPGIQQETAGNMTPGPVEEMDVDKIISEADRNIYKSLQMTFPGTYVTKKGESFDFGYDNETYNGYINKELTDGKGTYALQYSDGVISVKIISGAIVKEYNVVLGSDGLSMTLTDKETNESYEAFYE